MDGGALKAFGYESVFEEGRPEAEHPPAAWALGRRPAVWVAASRRRRSCIR